MRFLEILKESNKNVHLEHVEDEIFNHGSTGAKKAISFLANLFKLLSGHTEKSIAITVKWDGSPAVVCGINPENGKFFVGTKSVFAKNSKINYTPADIDINHGHSEDLSKKLKLALQYLPQLGIQTVVQGDFMFDSSNLKEINIDGVPHISFKPNTIVYVVPSDSDLGNQLLTSKLGIIFHTEYTGETILDMTANFGYSVLGLNKTSDVWFDDATYKDVSGSATLTSSQAEEIRNRIMAAQNAFGTIPSEVWESLQKNTDFTSTFKIFINAKVRKGYIGSNARKLLNEYIDFFKSKMEKEINELKSQDPTNKAVKTRLDKIDNSNNFIQNNQQGLVGIIELFLDIIDIKTTLIKTLQVAKNIGTFVETKNGDLKVTAPEGFVAVDHIGNAVKLVDRLTFSKENFLNK